MRVPVKIIDRKNDLKKGYFIRLEIGFILALLVMISAFKLDINIDQEKDDLVVDRQEEVFVEEIVQTKQEIKAPPPPRPMVPVEVPNDEIIVDDFIDLDAELDLDESFMELPPPPPPVDEDKAGEEEEIFIVVEQMPELIGGLASLNKHITYPEMARRAQIEGRVIVEFIIDKEGNVMDPKIIRGIGGGCDEVALKAVKKVKFKPGMQRGKPVLVRYSMPISFTLKDQSS
ncbi:MAG: energy transducer TonB [Gracilimonas sp.]|nr:energy transducer TonB [Gracilimonas sp.]